MENSNNLNHMKTQIVMKVALGVLFFTPQVYGQTTGSNVYWHIDPSVESCSMVIDPSLTQDQWKRYTRQVGELATFKSLASAKTIGKRHFSIAIDYSSTPVNQHDLAWINTFTHPDEDCPLGDRIKIPSIRGKYGISDKVEIGAFWTKALDANYGMIGGELKYSFIKESKKIPATAIRASFTSLTGVPDYNINIGSLDLLVSKKIAFLTPYLGIREGFVMGTETTTKVDLAKENLLVTQGFFGVTYSIWKINLAAEYNISDVNTFAFLIGFQSFKNN